MDWRNYVKGTVINTYGADTLVPTAKFAQWLSGTPRRCEQYYFLAQDVDMETWCHRLHIRPKRDTGIDCWFKLLKLANRLGRYKVTVHEENLVVTVWIPETENIDYSGRRHPILSAEIESFLEKLGEPNDIS